MIIQKIRFKNILGFGNFWSEIQLDANDLTIVTGDNGAGKSSMLLDTICYGLFGRLFREINKKQYINSITKKELVVEIFFSIGRDEYKVVRGIKPDVFEIYLNGALIPQNTDKRGYQDYLESNIIRCGFKTFTQIVILGSTAYKPFLNLDAAERRSVVDNILDLEIVSIMNTMLKKDFAALTETIRGEETRKTLVTEKIKIINDAILRSQASIDDDVKRFEDEIEVLRQDIDGWKSEYLPLNPDIEAIIFEMNKYNDKGKEHYSNLVRCDTDLKRLNTERAFYHHTKVCPTCRQDLDADFVLKLMTEKNTEIQKYEDAQKKIQRRKIDCEEKVNQLAMLIDKEKLAKRKNSSLDNNITSNEKTIDRTVKMIEDRKKSAPVINEQDLIDYNTDLMELNRNLNNLYNEKNIQQAMLKVLKDDGGKADVVRQYISDLNTLINKFLIDMDFFVQFYLDENFNETIKSRYRDEFSYNSFSDGQKLRINLAILFAWRELAKRRNSVSINLLVFDEVLSGSLDSKGVSDFIDILKKLHVNTNIYLITHSEAGMSRVDETIRVSMVQGFSRIDQDK